MKLIYHLKELENADILYVWPEEIVSKSQIDRHTEIDLNDDFDKLDWLVKDTATYKAFVDRLNGIPWEETDLYKIGVEKKRYWLTRLPYWDKMLNDIVENGYTHRPIRIEFDNHITILIGRDGDLIFHNGIHRLSAILLSKVHKKIPVRVALRHAQWEEFRNQVLEFQANNPRKQLYCQVPHPDLEHLKHWWGNDRADWVSVKSLYQGGALVDVGANWGTISSVLAGKGFNVTAIENHPTPLKFLEKISKFPRSHFKVLKGDFTGMKITTDTLLMINIAHHFIVDKRKHEKFVQFLNNLNVKEIFYQAHGWTGKIARHMKPEDMLNLIMKKTGMTDFKHLTTLRSRPLYHLFK
jgi:hypothetical protein